MADIGILGGTGPLGRGLAVRLAHAGHRVVLGSRDADRASGAAAELRSDELAISGATNQDAVDASEIVLVAVPFAGLRATLEHLTGLESRLVVSCVNPLAFDGNGPHAVAVDDGSAAEAVAATLAPMGATRVTAAFHHLAAPLLLAGTTAPDETVLVVGDDRADVDIVCALARDVVGTPGIDAGPLRNAQQIEAMTAVLIAINRRYDTHAGLAITGLGTTDH